MVRLCRQTTRRVFDFVVIVVAIVILVGTFGFVNRNNALAQQQIIKNVAPHSVYDASTPSIHSGDSVDLTLKASEKLVSIASDVSYNAWTFNDSVPGPILHVRQGQTINVTLVNDTKMAHSIDFHAAQTPWDKNYQDVLPGKKFSFSWKADLPGVYMYHCGTMPVLLHLANGMYGVIIVDPKEGWSPVAKEYTLVQSEFYVQKGAGSYNKSLAGVPDYVTFNGYANQYKSSPLIVKAGEKFRLYVLNAGPNHFSAFHVIGAMFEDVYMDGNPYNHMKGNQTITIAPGGGAMVELMIPTPGLYPFVTHSFADASKGATGVIKVTP